MTLPGFVGRLSLHPGQAPSVVCQRPMVGADMMRRLTEGRRATLLPDLLGTVFTLCATAQRATSRRAVRAAFGLPEAKADAERDALVLALTTAREHLQRLALDLPSLVPQPGIAPDPAWVRDAPVMALPQRAGGPAGDALASAAASLADWLQRRLLGMPCGRWLDAWHRGGGAWLDDWSRTHEHPFTRWLRAVHDAATPFVMPCRALDLVGDGEPGWRALAAGLAADATLAEHPRWQGAPAETGPWTRHGRAEPVHTLWDRLGARVADLVVIALLASERPLACGALTVAPGEGLAWSEMSRGLLVHWVRLEDGPLDVARAEVYRVIAPTEWNFHPEGALAHALAAAGPVQARLAAATLDPCLPFDVNPELRHA